MQQYTHPLRVRYDECDPMGFVHHSHYLKYFEIARTEMFRASGGNYRDFEASGLFVVVIRVECQYRLPARYDDMLSITASVEGITEAKIIHAYTVDRDAQKLVTAQVTMAVIDRTGKPQRIPDSLRSQ
jgi:acyl-CoA thioester hydrolase